MEGMGVLMKKHVANMGSVCGFSSLHATRAPSMRFLSWHEDTPLCGLVAFLFLVPIVPLIFPVKFP